jgi:hypothetical protein
MTTLTFGAEGIMRGESTASQLPGRTFGPADAYRHILLAAELTRAFGAERAVLTLTAMRRRLGTPRTTGLTFGTMTLASGSACMSRPVAVAGGTWLGWLARLW